MLDIKYVFSDLYQPDVTTDELDAIAHDACIKYGAYPSPLNYRGFPKSICTSVNNVACHGIPDDRKLKDGDIISVDISVSTIYRNFMHLKLNTNMSSRDGLLNGQNMQLPRDSVTL
uniref:Methionine aminopeptidase 1A n=2 Tax=Araneus ventricosus TaxID=182803 RepID=A0A4Y2QEM6_ARAVE|nr:Methionine aminopeptidase 1A [Araneus ventricosus]